MRTITDDERRARLARRHGLAPDHRYADVAAAACGMTALHATEPASVHLAAFARCGATRDQVDEALYVERSVVKQLAMRRTVFAFPRELLPAVWGSAAARVAAQQQRQLARDVEKAGITDAGDAWVKETTDAVLELLRTEGPLTTVALRERLPALESRIVIAAGKRYGGEFPIAPRVLTTLAASGAIVRGDNDGGWKTSRPRWTPTELWLPGAPPPTSETEGYATLVASWLRTFGPGTEADLVWWLGATKAAVRRALADVGAVEVALEDGTVGLLLPDDLDEEPPVEPWAALLPALDPTTMGWKERSFFLGDHAGVMFDANGNGGPTAWWDGRVVGGWTQRDDGEVVVVPVDPLPRRAEAALAECAAELTTWLAGDVVRSIYQSPLVRRGASVEMS